MIGKTVFVHALSHDNKELTYLVSVKKITKNGVSGTYAGNYNFHMEWADITRISLQDIEIERTAKANQLREEASALLVRAARLETQ